jgi:hypothetical protein
VDCEVSAGNKVDSTAYYLCPSCREVGTHLPLSIHPSHQSVSLGLLLDHHLGCGMCSAQRFSFACVLACSSDV